MDWGSGECEWTGVQVNVNGLGFSECEWTGVQVNVNGLGFR